MNNQNLDACVAGFMGYEDMGWHSVGYQDEKVRQWRVRVRKDGPHPFHYIEFKPSTVLADAWKVVNRMRSMGFLFTLSDLRSGFWYVRFNKPLSDNPVAQVGITEDTSETRAICLSALAAAGVKVVS